MSLVLLQMPELSAATFSILSDVLRVRVAVDGEYQGLVFGWGGVLIAVGVDGEGLAGIVGEGGKTVQVVASEL